MNRRNFLKNSSLAGITLTGLGAVACNGSEKKPITENLNSDPYSFEFQEISIEQLQKRMQEKTLSAKVLTHAY